MSDTPRDRRITCVVVDDDKSACLTIEHFIALMPSLHLLRTFTNSTEALQYLLANGGKVDVLFLDMEMPHLSGSELLRLLEKPPVVVCITAFPEYAVGAFELNVADYLVKPLHYPRFLKALQRAEHQYVQRRRPRPEATPSDQPVLTVQGLFLRVNSRIVQVRFENIQYVEALANYVTVVTQEQRHIVYTSLYGFHQRLPSALFVRVSRFHLVNMHWIQVVENNVITLLSGQQLTVGKTYRDSFTKRLDVI